MGKSFFKLKIPKMNNVSIQSITKTYDNGQTSALDQVSIEVQAGELFGLIGPDGAGKTSLFRILTTLLVPDQGSAAVCGYDVVEDFWKIRSIVGYMPGKFSLYQDLSVSENLQFFATIFKTTLEKNYDLIHDIYVQLEPFKDRPAGKLSGGMKQKLALCCALIHQPQVLFLDEPTTGVDPVSRREFWNMLKVLKAKGITIFVSTPYMDEANQCDRIALIQNGQVLDIDTLEGIIGKNRHPVYEVVGAHNFDLLRKLRAYPATERCFAFGDSLHLTLQNGTKGEGQLRQYLDSEGLSDTTLLLIEPNIEDIFIHLMEKNRST